MYKIELFSKNFKIRGVKIFHNTTNCLITRKMMPTPNDTEWQIHRRHTIKQSLIALPFDVIRGVARMPFCAIF